MDIKKLLKAIGILLSSVIIGFSTAFVFHIIDHCWGDKCAIILSVFLLFAIGVIWIYKVLE